MQTGYLGIQALHTNLQYMGGVCRFWYIPKEQVSSFPAVNPQTQFLLTEPTLTEDAAWYGPVKVPNSQLGFYENFKRNSAGIYYEQRIEGFHPGDSADNRINYENMPWHQYLVVGKLRAGSQYIIIGNDNSGADFVPAYSNGPSPENAAGNKITFYHESLYKAFILPTFLGENVLPPTDFIEDDPTGDTGTNQTEYIFFNTEPDITFPWNASRILRFGTFPEIQVWLTNGGAPIMINVPISCNNVPPNQTQFTITLPGEPGFIIIK